MDGLTVMFGIQLLGVPSFKLSTNNDVEGWHQRLKLYAHDNPLNLYLLNDLLWEKSQFIKLQVTLLSAKTKTGEGEKE